MQFDPHNSIIKLCAFGMSLEGVGKKGEAYKVFQQAWDESSTFLEKFTSAHYLARHQESVADKLKWDETALQFALEISDEEMKANYPSLYLNIAKCYEDIEDFEMAKRNYQLAFSFTHYLPDGGYGKMIKSGITKGLERIADKYK